jgi:hypothetical protein
MWRDLSTAVQAREALIDVLPGLVDRYGTATAALAADWYDELRDKKGVRGRFVAAPADLGDTRTEQLARVAVGPLFAAEPNWTAALVIAQGGLQRRIANGARLTVMESSIRDPQARGWQRVGDGSSCDFCSMLLGRGAVYSEATADFAAHDHCGCSAEPVFT